MSASRICTVILFASSAFAQRSNPCDARYHLLPPSDCTTALERIAESVVQLRAAIAQENAKMVESRRKFWATYPDKPGAAEARDEFGKALNAKDIYYLELMVTQAGGGATGIDFLGGKLDGGIPRNASAEFADWAEEISRNVEGNLTRNSQRRFTTDDLEKLMELPTMVYKAMGASSRWKDIYLVERDWAEFEAAGREPAGMNDPAVYYPAICVRFQKIPWKDAFSEYDGMAKALGEDVVRKAIQKVHAAPKANGGLLRVVPAGATGRDSEGVIGAVSSPILAVEGLSVIGDDRRLLVWWLTQNRPSRSSTIDQATKWQYADTTYHQLVLGFGEQEVLQASHQVRTAARRPTSGAVLDPAAIGATRQDPYPAFEDVVARKNPRGYVRALLAVKQNLNTTAEVDAAYKSFVSRSNEAAVLEAARKMAADKPNPNYDGDLDTLASVLNGSPVATPAPLSKTPAGGVPAQPAPALPLQPIDIHQRYRADLGRSIKANSDLMQFRQRTKTAPPADIQQALSHLNPELGVAQRALVQGDPDHQAEPALQDVEATLAKIDAFLQSSQ